MTVSFLTSGRSASSRIDQTELNSLTSATPDRPAERLGGDWKQLQQAGG